MPTPKAQALLTLLVEKKPMFVAEFEVYDGDTVLDTSLYGQSGEARHITASLLSVALAQILTGHPGHDLASELARLYGHSDPRAIQKGLIPGDVEGSPSPSKDDIPF